MPEKIFPILNRGSPILDRVRDNPKIKERPLIGFLAESPAEIRSLRRGVVAGLATSLGILLVIPMILEKKGE